MSGFKNFYKKILFHKKYFSIHRTNAGRGEFVINHRPDFDRFGNAISDYADLFRDWVQGNFANNVGDLTRFYLIYLALIQAKREAIPGDVAELGVFKGNSAKILASFSRSNGKHLYLFDTFKGFDNRDFKEGSDNLRMGMFRDTSLDYVKEFVGTEATTFVEGFFPESLKNVVMPKQFSIVHIDCDLAKPMKAGLEYFYPRMAPGGFMILHDYASGFWQELTAAVDVFFSDKREKPILMPDKSGTAIIRCSSYN